jgi:putative toxin-antitoxin system antitoxin component (TIGR02293 family)
VLTTDDKNEINVSSQRRSAKSKKQQSKFFGTREKAMRWLKTPVRSLGDRTPLSLLNSPEGVARVQDTLGRVEHGVW